MGNHDPMGDSEPIALFSSPRGHRVLMETPTQGLRNPSILSLEPKRFKESAGTTGVDPEDLPDCLPETLKPLAISTVQRRNELLSSRRSS